MTGLLEAAASERLKSYLATHDLSSTLGDRDSACSIATINLVLAKKLTDETPDTSSPVACRWVIRIQQKLPTEVRNSQRWKAGLVLLAGCGREATVEKRRLTIVFDWMWSVLQQLQAAAVDGGFGPQWSAMCRDRSYSAGRAAHLAAQAANSFVLAYAARAARDAVYAADRDVLQAAAHCAVDVVDAAPAESFDACDVLVRLASAQLL